ncbi:DUF2971 domain-containing protein [Microbulbifer agarilyticus]|uniref:DUF2971 domain-containing protein n=1 Tax=Microbulbifer agarilyticus TaxID=260552 RepID=UPI001C97C1AA|nr:DUF2971 domain-containing protein [Microbulbifer agarilyticus]MBY6191990.1 DUF2971 domain-containing protein [Microbulbifer agarilyticus]
MTEVEHIYLYKYLPFDEGSLCVLTDGTLKYTCPLDFNDPFDCRPAYDDQSLNEIDKNKKELIHAIGKKKKLSPAKRIQSKKKIANQIKAYLDSGQSLDNVLLEVGVVCLSTDPSNILMWSHYADFHKGFVVELKIPLYGTCEAVTEGGKNLIPLEVHYGKQRPEVKYGAEDPQATLQKMIFTKSSVWSYESEHRVLDHKRGPGIHEYNRNKLLVSVIAGMRMTDGNYERLSKILSSLRDIEELRDIKLYRAEPTKKEYKVVIPGHPEWG